MKIKYTQILWLSLIPLLFINIEFLYVTLYSLTSGKWLMIAPMIPFTALTYYMNVTLLKDLARKRY